MLGRMGACSSEKVSGKFSANPLPPGHTDGGVLLKAPTPNLSSLKEVLKCDISLEVDEADLRVVDAIQLMLRS